MNTGDCFHKKNKMKKYSIVTCISIFISFFTIIGIFSIVLFGYLISNSAQLSIMLINTVVTLLCVVAVIAYFIYIVPAVKKIRNQYRNYESGKIITLDMEETPVLFVDEEKAFFERINDLIDRKVLIRETSKYAEYLALQNQINPHFLYNTLEAIRGDAIAGKLYFLADTAQALATFFRYTISNMHFMSTVDEEIKNVENYFMIQHYRFGDKLQLEIYFLDAEDQIRNLFIPKLTLQPIVENSIFHGIEKKVSGGKITITFDQTETNLLISIKDTGIGMSEDEVTELNKSLNETTYKTEYQKIKQTEGKTHTGIAMKNVSRRIKLYFGEDYGLRIYSMMGLGTTVKITIPRQENAEDYENI